MSTVQVSNIHFESTGNNRIQSNGSVIDVYRNQIKILSGKSSELTISNGTSFGSISNSIGTSTTLPVGTYILAVQEPNTSFIEAGRYYDRTTYSSLYSVIGDQDGGYLDYTMKSTAYPLIYGGQVSAFAYGNNIFVAGGLYSDFFFDTYSFTIASSNNGATWTVNAPGIPTNIGSDVTSIAYGNGVFVATIQANIYSSSNGINWSNRSNATNSAFAVTYGNNIFVAIGQNGTARKSSDGITWTISTSATTAGMYGITYGNGIFVAVGNTGAVQYTSNGTSWTLGTSATSANLASVAYGNGTFVSVAKVNNVIQYSTDGAATWQIAPGSNRLFGNSTSVGFRNVSYVNNVFIASSSTISSGEQPGINYKSYDGISWEPILDQGTLEFTSPIAYGNGIYMAATSQGFTAISKANSTNFYVPLHPAEKYNTFFRSYVRAT